MEQGIVENSGHKLLYSGDEKTHRGGVGLLFSKAIQEFNRLESSVFKANQCEIHWSGL